MAFRKPWTLPPTVVVSLPMSGPLAPGTVELSGM